MAASSTFTASDGDGYELQMGRWSRLLAPRFVAFAGVASGDRVLDVGCGTGNLGLVLAQNRNIGSLVGVDSSSAYVEFAQRRNSDPRIQFQVGDACSLPFANASFDHSLSMLVLQFIPETKSAIREMRRVTRPGGVVAAATWDTRGGFVFYRMFFDTAAVVDPTANERRKKIYTRPMSRPGELAQAWRDAGLIDVVQDMLTIRMDFASFADFWAPMEGKDGPLADYICGLDSTTKEKVRDGVERAYLDGEADGPRSYAATSWVVRGMVPS
jgi:ubiquinone/menaquinone biosynthesis C-methylase UbiE